MENLIFIKIAMLISVSVIGWGIGKKWNMSSKDISTLLVYVISPFVIFTSILESPSDISYFKYSIGAFLTSSLFAFAAYALANAFWDCSKRNLFSFAGGTGNTGYFALPIVLSIFEPAQWAVAIFIIIGVNFYEFTIGYFITAKGKFNTGDCIKRVMSLPIIYATMLALGLKYMGVRFPDEILSFMDNFKGAYSILGMMVIGMTMSSYSKLEFDWKFSFIAIGWKHICVPVVGVLFFSMLGIDENIVLVIALMLATPMAGNVVVVSNQLGVHPQIAATTVMFSTLMSIILIPASLHFFQFF